MYQVLFDADLSRASLIKQSALVALARVTSDDAIKQRVAAGLLSENEDVREAATRAATELSSSKTTAPNEPLLPDTLSATEMDARTRVTQALSANSRKLNPELRHRALVALKPDIIEHARVALRSSASTAEAVLEQLTPRAGTVAFGQLLTPADMRSSATTKMAAAQAVEDMRHALGEEIAALASGPHGPLSRKALAVLRITDSAAARSILAAKVADPSQEVHQAALQAILTEPTSDSFQVLEQYLKHAESWGRRRRVAAALGALLAESSSKEAKSGSRRLLETLAKDKNQFVRAEARSHLN